MEDFEAVLRTNVLGVWLSMKLCVEPMKRRGGGSIIALSSIAGVIGSPGLLPYIASKHAVLGMVRTAAIELGEFGVRVNAIGPGPIQNRMIDSIIDQASPDDPAAMAAGVRDAIPLKRFGNNEEVASLALFLASDESSYCSGGIHMIDGGYTAA
jgi:NAD(P)-dependent dehydrogenase (short-subunit alcohol dehydrogenase family)